MNNLCIHLHDCRGLEKSHIFFRCTQEHECNSGTWMLQSLLDSNKTLEFDGDLPIGLKTWKIKKDYAYCNKKSGWFNRVNLTFSQCYPNKFTCGSGHCISLEDRCSIAYDCKDQTDEKNCRKIKIKDDYAKEIFPIETNEPFIVYINISINSLPDISTTDGKFTVDFFLNLRWQDLRLDLLDLNQDFVMNTMSQQELDEIWQPKLVFPNALGPQNPIGPMMGTLIKQDKRMEDTISATECKVVLLYFDTSLQVKCNFWT